MNQNTSTKSNFGARGWLYILICGVALILMSSLTTDSLNVTVPQMATEKGWDQAFLLSVFTYAGWIGVIAAFVMGYLIDKLGTRIIMSASFLVGGIAYIWWGASTTLAAYCISATLLAIAANTFGMISCSNLLSYWFPTKKGLALGWATIGNNLSPVIVVPIMSYLLPIVGIAKTALVFGIVMLVMCVVCWLLVRNKPEDVPGCYPDNNPDFVPEPVHESTLTVWGVLKNKNIWLCGIIYGFLYIITVGLMSQFIPRLVTFGYTTATATTIFSVVALIGCVGSYFWGWLDQKIGTKWCTVVFSLFFGGAVLFNVLPGTICLYISLFMIGCSIGGTTNLSASLVSSLFGRYDYARAWSVVNPISSALRCSAYLILSVAMTITGSLDGAYIFFVVLAVIAAGLTLLIKEPKKTE